MYRRGASLVINSGGAHFAGGEKFRLGHPRDDDWRADYVTEFTVSRPGEVFWWPDHHGSVIFIVKIVEPGKVVLRYETSRSAPLDGAGEITLLPFKRE